MMDAYPGDEYVDLVGLDIYNGAGKGAFWRSFRKEGIENYFVLTDKLPQKPIIVCEAASRERRAGECSNCENKGEWIKEMTETLESDMSRVKLLSWFNEKEYFRVNSSKESEKSYEKNVIQNNYFSEGSKDLKAVIENGKTVAEK
jgi:beta-mannanase